MPFDEIEKYKINDHFFLDADSDLEKVCNATKKGSGVFVVYELARGRVRLVYIGSSGVVLTDGSIVFPKNGLFDTIVNGIQFNDKRSISWPQKLKKENIDALDIYWYETFSADVQDIPLYVEAILMQSHFNLFGTLPDWNEEF